MNHPFRHGIVLKLYVALFLAAMLGPVATHAQVPATTMKVVPKIIGKVFDDERRSLANVSVLLKGNKKIGTASNNQGDFVFSPDKLEGVLLFSHTGFKTRETRTRRWCAHKLLVLVVVIKMLWL